MASLWQESLLFAQHSGRTINANPPASGGLFSFTLQTVGGAQFAQQLIANADEQRGIAWQIENGSAGALQLMEFHTAAGPLQQPLIIEFPQQLFPGVAFVPVAPDRIAVVGITAGGLVYMLELGIGDSSLHSLSADRLSYIDVSTHWASLGHPACISGTRDHVVVGGSNGPVLCLPVAWLHESAVMGRGSASGAAVAPSSAGSRPFELRESSWGLRSLIAGVWQRSQSPSVISAVPLASHDAKGSDTTLVVTYDDCTVRGFSMAKHSQVFTEALEASSSGAKRTEPVFAAVCPDTSQPGGATLVVQFESQDTLHRTVVAYQLAAAGGGRLAMKQKMPLAAPPNASVLAAHAAADTIWVLVKAAAGSGGRLLAFSKSAGGQELGAAALLEAGGLPGVTGLGASSSIDSMMLALWEGALAAGSTTPGVGAPAAASAAAVDAAAEEQVLARVLTPTTLCRASLRDALAHHGAHMTVVEVETVSLAQLRVYLVGVVATIQRRQPGLSLARCWATLLGTYQEAWSRRHPLLALLPHPGMPSSDSGPMPWLATVRGGATLGVVRSAAPVEALAAQSADGSSAASLPQGQGIQVLGLGSQAAVAACTREVAGLLGPLALDAFVSLLVSGGVSAVQTLVPHFTALLLDGPGAAGLASAAAPRDDVAREQHTAWRQRRQRALLRLGQVLGSLPDPASAIKQYCEQLRPVLSGLSSGEADGQAPAASSSKAAATFLVSSARQVAHAHICAARDVLLLLGVVVRTRALGTVPLDGAQLAALQPGLVVQLGELVQRAAVAYWLCSTPATVVGAAAEMDSPTKAMATLQLGAGRMHQSAAAAAQPATGPRDLSLAAKLLPSIAAPLLAKAASSTTQAATAAQALAVLLQYGQRSSGAGASAGTGTPVSAHILQLGYSLFLAREYAPLTDLTRLAQQGPPAVSSGSEGRPSGSGIAAAGARDASGPELLRGLGLACRLRELSGAERAASVKEAAGCFFRAAAALHAGHGAGQATQGILTVLNSLWQQLTGTEPPALPASSASQAPGARQTQEAASLQLLLCEVAMMLFEREQAPDGAAMFARAALQHLPAVCGVAGSGNSQQTHAHGHVGMSPARKQKTGPSTSTAAAAGAPGTGSDVLKAREGRLWNNIFSYCVEQGAWEDAYAALVSNPVPERSLECLRKLVHELSERGEVLVLCSLPLAGSLPLANAEPGSLGAGAPTMVSLLGEAVAALQRRALNTDLSTTPRPYRVLYDFHVARSDYRGAALAMVAYARRLRSEGQPGPATVTEVMRAYEAALNALSLLDEGDAWLDMGADAWVRAHTLPGPPPAPLFPQSTALPAADTGVLGSAVGTCLTLSGLRREYAIMRAAAAVAVVSSGGAGSNPLQQATSSPVELLGALLTVGQVDEALALASAAWPAGSAGRGAALERVVGALAGAAAWAQLQQQGSGQQTGDAGAYMGEAAMQADTGASTSAFTLTSLTADPFERQALLGCGGQVWGARAAPLWAKLRALLQGVAGGSALAGADMASLRVAAADAALKADRRLALPLWLVELFLPAPGAADEQGGGMAGAVCGPAALMDLYLAHDRLKDAVALVQSATDAWSKTDPRKRRKHHAAWMPHARIEALRARLLVDVERSRPGASSLLSKLDAAVAAHMQLAAHDTPQPSAGPAGFAAGSFGGMDAPMAWA